MRRSRHSSLLAKVSSSRSIRLAQLLSPPSFYVCSSPYPLFPSPADTLSTTLSFLLHHLSLHPAIQSHLRSTLLATLPPDPTLADVDAVEYLTAVINETLRLSPTLQSTYRVATRDAVIPLRKAVVKKDGSETREVRVKKGTLVHVP